jgi:hypothetical protein
MRHPLDCGAIESCVEQVDLNEENLVKECVL